MLPLRQPSRLLQLPVGWPQIPLVMVDAESLFRVGPEKEAADEAAATISKLEAIIANLKSVNAAGTMASSSLVPAFANEPSRKVHIRSSY